MGGNCGSCNSVNECIDECTVCYQDFPAQYWNQCNDACDPGQCYFWDWQNQRCYCFSGCSDSNAGGPPCQLATDNAVPNAVE